MNNGTVKTLWERALAEGKLVEEKATGIQAKVVETKSGLFLDDGGAYISPVTEFTEDDFWIVNE